MLGANDVQSPCGDRTKNGPNEWQEPGTKASPHDENRFYTGYCAPLGNDAEWNTNPDYMLRCKCPINTYGHDCSMVKPNQCPNTRDWVWDGKHGRGGAH